MEKSTYTYSCGADGKSTLEARFYLPYADSIKTLPLEPLSVIERLTY